METHFQFVLFQVVLFLSDRFKTSLSQGLGNGGSNTDSSYFFYQQSELPRDCSEVKKQCPGTISSGVYPIKPDGFHTPFDVYCDLEDGGGGWTLLQRRGFGQTDFNRSWAEFKEGFGFLNGEFLLGNEKLAYLTNQKNYQLRIDMVTSNGSSFFVSYDVFRISDEWSGYKLLSLGRYNGTAEPQWCPTNMIMKICSCQASCAQPNVCERTCTEEHTCVCPEGFLMNGDSCVSPEECGCFESEIGVISEGASTSNSDCSKRCTCEANELTCDVSYQCDENALCEERNNTRACYCRSGYRGEGTTCTRATYTDCYDVYTSHSVNDGVYTIQPTGWTKPAFQVYCDMSNGGGWTVFQRRRDGSVDFRYRDWASYKAGFGTPTTELWLGNEKLNHMTNQKTYKMRIDYVNRDGVNYNMNYDSFHVSNEADNYRLTLGTFTGNTGYDYMNYHRGMAFSTHDDDNDRYYYNCASYYRGGWWYNSCYNANLNGDYSATDYYGVALYNYDTSSYDYRLRYTEMKIRPV